MTKLSFMKLELRRDSWCFFVQLRFMSGLLEYIEGPTSAAEGFWKRVVRSYLHPLTLKNWPFAASL